MTQSRGERFVGSLQDGRKVWLNGRIVQDVTGHSAFAGTIRTIRELFDSLDDPEFRDRVGFISPKTGRHVHKSFLVPTSYEDLLSKRDAYQLWANWSNGVMSRLSESGRSYITGWYAARESFRKYDNAFPDKIARYYEQVRDEDRIVISVQLDPPVDRSRNSLSEDPDSLLHIVKVTGDGVVIRGAKVMATAAPYAHDIIVSSNQQLQEDLPQYAYMISVPLNASGIHIVCREPFSSEDKEEHPISHRYDEMDATVIFDDVFVSWDRVFLHHNPEGVWLARIHQRDNTLANHQMVVRLAAKLEFVAGVGSLIAESIGADRFQHVQEKLGELFIQIETIKGLYVAAEAQAEADEYGTLFPQFLPLQTAMNLGNRFYPRAVEVVQQIGGSSLLQSPYGSTGDSGEIRPLIEKYFRTGNLAAEERIQLFKLAWDLIGSSLGSRLELYERFFAGDPVRTYAIQYESCDRAALKSKVKQILQEKEPLIQGNT